MMARYIKHLGVKHEAPCLVSKAVATAVTEALPEVLLSGFCRLAKNMSS